MPEAHAKAAPSSDKHPNVSYFREPPLSRVLQEMLVSGGVTTGMKPATVPAT